MHRDEDQSAVVHARARDVVRGVTGNEFLGRAVGPESVSLGWRPEAFANLQRRHAAQERETEGPQHRERDVLWKVPKVDFNGARAIRLRFKLDDGGEAHALADPVVPEVLPVLERRDLDRGEELVETEGGEGVVG